MPAWGWKTVCMFREYIPYSGHKALVVIEHSFFTAV